MTWAARAWWTFRQNLQRSGGPLRRGLWYVNLIRPCPVSQPSHCRPPLRKERLGTPHLARDLHRLPEDATSATPHRAFILHSVLHNYTSTLHAMRASAATCRAQARDRASSSFIKHDHHARELAGRSAQTYTKRVRATPPALETHAFGSQPPCA